MTAAKAGEPRSSGGDPATAAGGTLGTTAGLELPTWAIVTEKRRAHIARVTGLIDSWAAALHSASDVARAWHDAARWHDALRDAPEPLLRELTGDTHSDAKILHGPAAAARLAADGETRTDVLDAIRWHTVGSVDWGDTGRALYMADFLEPGRAFAREERAALAAQVPTDFDGTFRQVVQTRLEWTLREGKALLLPTVALWNSVR
jgi:2-amino-4-hydroxy-6-hydroxymethyldihydropteridine diphosphokinase